MAKTKKSEPADEPSQGNDMAQYGLDAIDPDQIGMHARDDEEESQGDDGKD